MISNMGVTPTIRNTFLKSQRGLPVIFYDAGEKNQMMYVM
jgi:hypothetical protein